MAARKICIVTGNKRGGREWAEKEREEKRKKELIKYRG
jgi:hypothetical protein